MSARLAAVRVSRGVCNDICEFFISRNGGRMSFSIVVLRLTSFLKNIIIPSGSRI